ncbi:hypothetical protein ACOMHN_044682 [Nucella lapillus]
MQPSDCYPTLPLGSKMMCINISWNLASCTTAHLPPSAAAVRGDCNLHPLMVPPFLQPHPDLQSAVGNAPLSSKHPAQLPTTDCLLSIISPWAVNPVTPLHSRLHHRCSRVVNPATPLLSRLHHHCRRAVNPLPWHSRLHHRRRRVVNPAMPLNSRPHHQHCCCVLVTLL